MKKKNLITSVQLDEAHGHGALTLCNYSDRTSRNSQRWVLTRTKGIKPTIKTGIENVDSSGRAYQGPELHARDQGPASGSCEARGQVKALSVKDAHLHVHCYKCIGK